MDLKLSLLHYMKNIELFKHRKYCDFLSVSGKVTTVDNFTTSWTDGPKDICVDDNNNASCLNINTNDAKKVCGATFNATVPPVGTHQFTYLGDDQECINHQCALTRFTNHPAYRGHMFCYQTRDGPKCDCQLTVEIK